MGQAPGSRAVSPQRGAGCRDPTRVAISARYLLTRSDSIRHRGIAGMDLALSPDWLVRDGIERATLVRLLPEYDVSATGFDNAIWCNSR